MIFWINFLIFNLTWIITAYVYGGLTRMSFFDCIFFISISMVGSVIYYSFTQALKMEK